MIFLGRGESSDRLQPHVGWLQSLISAVRADSRRKKAKAYVARVTYSVSSSFTQLLEQLGVRFLRFIVSIFSYCCCRNTLIG